MPTDGRPSAKFSVIVAFSSNYFSTLCEMPTDLIPSVWMSMIMHCTRKIIFVLPIYLPANT
jgi:hypothetical protein